MTNIAENIFTEGVDSDIHPKKISANRVIDNVNAQQIDINGNGGQNQSKAGNAHDPNQDIGFILSNGFVPLGRTTYLGVGIILSFNPQTGEGEIGTYPSPKLNGLGGYDKVYRPLKNFIGIANAYLVAYNERTINGNDWGSVGHLAALQPLRQDFRTTLFNWSCGNIQVKAREDYDGSVNIYFCDWRNSNRCINCGFNIKTGVYTARTYFDKSFEQAVNVLNETLWPIELFNTDENTCPVEIANNGNFKCGNIHFYFRYVDESFNSTSFVGRSEAVMIVPSDDGTEWAQTIKGGDSLTPTNKSVKLSFNTTNLDLSYRYLQIAYVRNLEDGGFDVQLIDRHYELWELINVSPVVEVTDYEDKVQLTIAEVIKPKRRDDISRDVDSLEERLWFFNSKTDELYHPELRDFTKTITTEIINDLTWEHPIQFDKCTINQVAYRNYRFTYLFVGYFRKEWYPFNVRYLLKSGKWTDGFPITGRDHYLGVDNDKGLVRFPSVGANKPVDANGNLKPMGIKFIADGANLGAWMKQNVVGFEIVRADRIENLVYQGLSTYCFKSYDSNLPPYGDYNIKDNCTNIAEPKSILYPKRWDVNKMSYWYATTRIFPVINLLQVRWYELNHPITGAGLGEFPQVIEELHNLNFNGDENKVKPVLPWIYTFKEKLCAIKLSPVWAGAKQHYLNGDIGAVGGTNNPPQGIRLLGDDDGTFVDSSDPLQSGDGNGPSGRDFRGLNAYIPVRERGKYGLFVPDFCMKKTFVDREYFIDDIGDWFINLPNPASVRYARLKEGVNWLGFGKDYSLGTYSGRGLNIKSFFWDTTLYGYRNNGTTKRALVFGVPQWTLAANHQFASYASEGEGESFDDEEETQDYNINLAKRAQDFSDLIFYYMQSHNKSENFISTFKNAEFGISAYLGIDFSHLLVPDQPNNWYWRLLNVYRRDPETDDQSSFIAKNHDYFPIGRFVRLETEFPLNMGGGGGVELKEFKRYQGDCFLQRTYMKTMANPVYPVSKKDDSYDGFIAAGQTRFTSGNIVGVITENAANTGVRHDKPDAEPGENKETFYPQEKPEDPHEYAGENRAMESYLYNSGYSKTLCHQPVAGYDDQMPYKSRFFTTRIWFTYPHTIGELQDGWRLSELNSHRDYENDQGEIVRGINGGGILYTINAHGARRHYVNERAIKKGEGEGDIVLGTQTDILSGKAKIISEEYGCQQMRGVDISDEAIYGQDLTQGVIWAIPFGAEKLVAISIEKNYNNRTIDTIQSVVGDTHTDITATYPDNPACDKGIVTFYDRDYSNIYFGYFDNSNKNQCHVFNEKQGRFIERTTWSTPFAILINSDLYTAHPTQKDRFYRHGIETFNGVSNHSTFYDVIQPFEFEISVNKYNELEKVFDSIQLISNFVTPIAVDYRTEYQSGSHNPFDTIATLRYIKPKYRENAWRFPIKRCDAVNDSHYLVKSHFRSQHLLIRVKYLTNLPIFVNGVLTTFRASKH